MRRTREKVIYDVINLETGERYETTVSEIAEKYSISRPTVYQWIKKGMFNNDPNQVIYRQPKRITQNVPKHKCTTQQVPQAERTTQTQYNEHTSTKERHNTITPNEPPKAHTDEIWTSIKGYEDKYQISNYGNVYSILPRKLLKQTINQAGYYQVGLSLKGKIKSAPVHRLVAEHFLYNEENSKRVTHLDGNKLNNKYTNLEWLVPQKVVAYHLETRKEITYKSIKECSEALGVSYTSVWKCLNNELSNIGLFTFYYA